SAAPDDTRVDRCHEKGPYPGTDRRIIAGVLHIAGGTLLRVREGPLGIEAERTRAGGELSCLVPMHPRRDGAAVESAPEAKIGGHLAAARLQLLLNMPDHEVGAEIGRDAIEAA